MHSLVIIVAIRTIRSCCALARVETRCSNPPERWQSSADEDSSTTNDHVLSLSEDMRERPETEKILDVLRPYAANWSGSLGRGDLVVPQREIPRLINDLLDAITETADAEGEVSDTELFRALADAQRSPSVQDQVAKLRQSFRILKR
jgi:hypothetical protein